jgi:hypothetical protein
MRVEFVGGPLNGQTREMGAPGRLDGRLAVSSDPLIADPAPAGYYEWRFDPTTEARFAEWVREEPR